MNLAAKYPLYIVAILFVLLATNSAYAKSSVDAESNVYKPSVKNWKNTVDKATFTSDSWMWNLDNKDRYHKNQYRSSVLSVPSTSIPDDITLVVWFHGLGGFTQSGFENRILPQMEFLVSGKHSFALAIPEMPWSTNTTTPRGRQGKVWTGRHGDNFNKFYKDVIRTVESHFLHPDYEANIEYTFKEESSYDINRHTF